MKVDQKWELTENARRSFKQHFSYSDITSRELYKLIEILKQDFELYIYYKYEPNKRFKVQELRKKDLVFDDEGSIKYLDITMSSHYFKRRQCITFEENGFIGFCGWADLQNTRVIVGAFKKWIGWLKASKAM